MCGFPNQFLPPLAMETTLFLFYFFLGTTKPMPRTRPITIGTVRLLFLLLLVFVLISFFYFRSKLNARQNLGPWQQGRRLAFGSVRYTESLFFRNCLASSVPVGGHETRGQSLRDGVLARRREVQSQNGQGVQRCLPRPHHRQEAWRRIGGRGEGIEGDCRLHAI